MSYLWIILAIVASISSTVRDLYIKKRIQADPQLVVASTRFIAFFVMLICYPFFGDGFHFEGNLPLFIGLMLITVTLTFVATTLKVHIIQKEEISMSSPLLSMTPIFIIPWAMLLLNEKIQPLALLGIMTTVIGALIVLDIRLGALGKVKKSYLGQILVILMIYGLTTVIDKLEIGMIGGYMYSLIWTGSSAIAGFITIKKYSLKTYVTNTFSKVNIIQASMWALTFTATQLAVQYSYQIPMNTAYIKSITYLSIILNVLVGGKLFTEGNIGKKLLGAFIIIGGNLIIIFSV